MADNIKLSFNTPEYIVKDNVVICKLSAKTKNTHFGYHTTAVAYPKDGDTFDEAIGKKVALTKAELNLYKQFRANMKLVIREFNNELKNYECAINNMDKYIEHNKKYLKEF